MSLADLNYFCSCATSNKNIEDEDAEECVFATD